MPELPELEVVSEVLNRRILGLEISSVEVLPPGGPLIIRDIAQVGFDQSLIGSNFDQVKRRGKFLLFTIRSRLPDLYLAVNPKLAGRLQLASKEDRRLPKTHLILTFMNGLQLRYVDKKQMGQVYLSRNPEAIPGYAGMGPEPFELSPDDFRRRLLPFRGEIKGVFTRGDFVAGIGNAYADEILWAARLHPYRKRTQLTDEEIDRLYDAMQDTLRKAIEKVRDEMGEDVHLEPRNFLAIHMKTGEPCPRCGTRISLVGANQRITNFCRTCQPGGLIRGMAVPNLRHPEGDP